MLAAVYGTSLVLALFPAIYLPFTQFMTLRELSQASMSYSFVVHCVLIFICLKSGLFFYELGCIGYNIYLQLMGQRKEKQPEQETDLELESNYSTNRIDFFGSNIDLKRHAQFQKQKTLK